MDDIIYVLAIGNGLAVGVVFFTRERAEETAKRLKLRYYEVIPYRINGKEGENPWQSKQTSGTNS